MCASEEECPKKVADCEVACLKPPDEGLVGQEQIALLAPHAHSLQTPLNWVFEPSLASLVPPVTLVEGCSVSLDFHPTPVELCKCVSIALCCYNLEQENIQWATIWGCLASFLAVRHEPFIPTEISKVNIDVLRPHGKLRDAISVILQSVAQCCSKGLPLSILLSPSARGILST